ncbi:P-loop NTPase, partial [Thermococcus sp. ES12]|uniref:MinD/ParA family ATP-binding protein n=1 Tax=Thermococcus sp. ES12 TaxID=1638246 RepID=UPI001F0D74D5
MITLKLNLVSFLLFKIIFGFVFILSTNSTFIYNDDVVILKQVSCCVEVKIKMVVIVVTGRGGAGKTTLTSNLSVYFAKNKYRTLAVDGDLYLPKLGLHFGIDFPRYNIHSLLRDPALKV